MFKRIFRRWFPDRRVGYEQEAIATELGRALRRRFPASAVDIEIKGGGVHWHVEIRNKNRSVRVHCFHYGAGIGGLMLGLRGNRHQSKVDLGGEANRRIGAEYMANYFQDEQVRTNGRTQDRTGMIASVEAWLLDRADLPALFAAHDFVNTKGRALERIAVEMNRELAGLGSNRRATLDQVSSDGEFCELWVYAGERSLRIDESADGVTAALLDRRTQLATLVGADAVAIAGVVYDWVDRKIRTTELKITGGRLEYDPFVDLFEQGDFAGWHWAHVLRQAEHYEVLAYFRPLLDGIQDSRSLSRFYSFTSHNRLCLSRCSLYPFDTYGLPMIAPGRDAARPFILSYGEEKVDLEGGATEILEHLEENLRAGPEPYFGNLDDRLHDLLNRRFVEIGSEMRAVKVQRQQWLRLEIYGPRGDKCRCSSGFDPDEVSIELYDAHGVEQNEFEGSVSEVADRAISWLL